MFHPHVSAHASSRTNPLLPTSMTNSTPHSSRATPSSASSATPPPPHPPPRPAHQQGLPLYPPHVAASPSQLPSLPPQRVSGLPHCSNQQQHAPAPRMHPSHQQHVSPHLTVAHLMKPKPLTAYYPSLAELANAANLCMGTTNITGLPPTPVGFQGVLPGGMSSRSVAGASGAMDYACAQCGVPARAGGAAQNQGASSSSRASGLNKGGVDPVDLSWYCEKCWIDEEGKMPELLNLDKCSVGQLGSFFANSAWPSTRPIYTPIETDEICEASKDHLSSLDVKNIFSTFQLEARRLGIGVQATERDEDRVRREEDERERAEYLERQKQLLERARRDRDKWEQEKEKWEQQRRAHMQALGSSSAYSPQEKKRRLDMPDFDEL